MNEHDDQGRPRGLREERLSDGGLSGTGRYEDGEWTYWYKNGQQKAYGAPPPSNGSQERWAGENVCRCYTNGYTAAKRPPRILSETASDLLFPVGMTGFEPAAP